MVYVYLTCSARGTEEEGLVQLFFEKSDEKSHLLYGMNVRVFGLSSCVEDL